MKKVGFAFVVCLLTAFSALSQQDLTIVFDTAELSKPYPHPIIINGQHGSVFLDAQVLRMAEIMDKKNECCEMKEQLRTVLDTKTRAIEKAVGEVSALRNEQNSLREVIVRDEQLIAGYEKALKKHKLLVVVTGVLAGAVVLLR